MSVTAAPPGAARLSAPVDGFRLGYDLHEAPASAAAAGTPTVVLLHGWPGDRADYRHVVPRLAGRYRVVVPDLRGFGDSDRHPLPPAEAYTADAQVRSVLALLDELDESGPIVWGGYDIGSRLIQTVLAQAPDRVAAAVMTPPLPGAGERLLAPEAQTEFWYQQLHRLPLADDLLDGRPDAARAYLRHIWTHWSGPQYVLTDDAFERSVALYSRPGAFTASVAWYRSRVGSVGSARSETPPAQRVAIPVEVLWPEHDPLFPAAWSDRLGEWFEEPNLEVRADSGHFVPLEAPRAFAAAVDRAASRTA